VQFPLVVEGGQWLRSLDAVDVVRGNGEGERGMEGGIDGWVDG